MRIKQMAQVLVLKQIDIQLIMKKAMLTLLLGIFLMTNVQAINGNIEMQHDPYPDLHRWLLLPNGTSLTLEQMIEQDKIAILVGDITITPNPVRHNQIGRVKFELPVPMDVKVVITNMQGKTIKVENLGKRDAGRYTEMLQVSDLTNGMYNYTFITRDGRATERFVVAR